MSETRTHDYTQRGWGHDFGIDAVTKGGRELSAHGWGRGIRVGDYLILPNGARGTRYQVARITYFADPPDMWRADLRFVPREVAVS